MKLIRYDSVQLFYDAAAGYLLAHEVEHNLPIGICMRLMDQPEYAESPPYFALVHEGDEVVAAALMTPPFNLVLTLARTLAAVDLLVDDVRAIHALPGVLGPVQESRAFLQAWQARTGQPYRLRTAERIYQLDRVIAPRPATAGTLREATLEDRSLLVDWFYAFVLEAHGDGDRAQAERNVDQRLRNPAIHNYIWEDGVPVSFAGAYRGTPNSARIGPVYTPPDARGRGYASACVAEVSQRQLDAGCAWCCLFTDLSNPTSNHVYQAIGYQPVADVDDYVFE